MPFTSHGSARFNRHSCTVASLKVPALIVDDVATKERDLELFPQHNIADLNSGITFIVFFSQKKPLRWEEINTHTHTHTCYRQNFNSLAYMIRKTPGGSHLWTSPLPPPTSPITTGLKNRPHGYMEWSKSSGAFKRLWKTGCGKEPPQVSLTQDSLKNFPNFQKPKECHY